MTTVLTQKLKLEFSNVVFQFNLLWSVSHLVEDTSEALAVVTGVGEVRQSLDEVGLAVRGLVHFS